MDITSPKRRKREYVVVSEVAHKYLIEKVKESNYELSSYRNLQDKLFEKSYSLCSLSDQNKHLLDEIKRLERKCQETEKNYEEVISRREASHFGCAVQVNSKILRNNSIAYDCSIVADDKSGECCREEKTPFVEQESNIEPQGEESLIPLILKGVSKDLYESVANENIKLKKENLHLKTKFSTNSSRELEMENSIAMLREENLRQRQHIKYLESQVNNQEVPDLSRQLIEKDAEILKLKRDRHIMQQLMINGQDEKKKLKENNQVLQSQLDTMFDNCKKISNKAEQQTKPKGFVLRSGLDIPKSALDQMRNTYTDVQHDGPTCKSSLEDRTLTDLQHGVKDLNLSSSAMSNKDERTNPEGSVCEKRNDESSEISCVSPLICDNCLQEFRSIEKLEDHKRKCLY